MCTTRNHQTCQNQSKIKLKKNKRKKNLETKKKCEREKPSTLQNFVHLTLSDSSQSHRKNNSVIYYFLFVFNNYSRRSISSFPITMRVFFNVSGNIAGDPTHCRRLQSHSWKRNFWNDKTLFPSFTPSPVVSAFRWIPSQGKSKTHARMLFFSHSFDPYQIKFHCFHFPHSKITHYYYLLLLLFSFSLQNCDEAGVACDDGSRASGVARDEGGAWGADSGPLRILRQRESRVLGLHANRGGSIGA